MAVWTVFNVEKHKDFLRVPVLRLLHFSALFVYTSFSPKPSTLCLLLSIQRWVFRDCFAAVFVQGHSVARSLLYSVILCFRADALQSSRTWLWISDCALKYKARFWISSEVVYLQRYSVVVIWQVQCENFAISAHVLVHHTTWHQITVLFESTFFIWAHVYRHVWSADRTVWLV